MDKVRLILTKLYEAPHAGSRLGGNTCDLCRKNIDQALSSLRTLIEGCLGEKKEENHMFENFKNKAIGYNQKHDEIKERLEKIFEEDK